MRFVYQYISLYDISIYNTSFSLDLGLSGVYRLNV